MASSLKLLFEKITILNPVLEAGYHYPSSSEFPSALPNEGVVPEPGPGIRMCRDDHDLQSD